MKTTWRTCGEHPHCQEEIREGEYQDRKNEYVVIHHRDAQEQTSSVNAPERFIRAHELLAAVEDLNDRAQHLTGKLERLDAWAAKFEDGVVNRTALLDAREQGIDARVRDRDADLREIAGKFSDVHSQLWALDERLDRVADRVRPFSEGMKGDR